MKALLLAPLLLLSLTGCQSQASGPDAFASTTGDYYHAERIALTERAAVYRFTDLDTGVVCYVAEPRHYQQMEPSIDCVDRGPIVE